MNLNNYVHEWNETGQRERLLFIYNKLLNIITKFFIDRYAEGKDKDIDSSWFFLWRT